LRFAQGIYHGSFINGFFEGYGKGLAFLLLGNLKKFDGLHYQGNFQNDLFNGKVVAL
jgi:hypothetical protein